MNEAEELREIKRDLLLASLSNIAEARAASARKEPCRGRLMCALESFLEAEAAAAREEEEREKPCGGRLASC